MTNELYREALARFEELFARVGQAGLREPTAITLATADEAGRPSARTVLLKGVDERGFVFYTNARSRKGGQLERNPWGALLLFSQPVFEQAHIEGPIGLVSDEETDAYWATRSRESRIGAWASEQSETLGSRRELDERYERYEREFEGGDVPRPAHWRGYRLAPERIEFWRSGEHRLHDRDCYERDANGVWSKRLLNP